MAEFETAKEDDEEEEVDFADCPLVGWLLIFGDAKLLLLTG